MKYTFPFLLAMLALSVTAAAQLQKINTLAGNGTFGFSGDGFSAPAAQLHGPLAVAVDTAGNTYIEDYYNLRIRKVNATGMITTVAGTGTDGNDGNGTIATSAKVHAHGIALNKRGELYIADGTSGVIRKVNSLGIISTIAGTGTLGYDGDGGPATAALLDDINGIAFGPKGDLYVADAKHNVVRKIDTAGMITTFAGTRSIYTGNDTAGYYGNNGPATTALLDSPYALAVDKIGNVYIADYKNNVVRKVDTDGVISAFAGYVGFGSRGYDGDNGLATFAKMNNPAALAVDSNRNVFIADADNNVIRKVDSFGVITTVVGNGFAGFGGDLGWATGSNLYHPFGLAVDKNGSLYIADANNQRVRKTYYPGTSAVESVIKNTSIEVYPNPATSEIEISGLAVSDKVSIYDMAGKKVGAEQTISVAGRQLFSIASMPAGVYMLHIAHANGGANEVIKLVKE